MNKAAENVLVAMHTLGWQGGTIHQVVEATGLTIEQIHEADDIAALVKETRTPKQRLRDGTKHIL
ncbi:MAG: hypothetical protein D4S01_02960 [Dehalococcoidia bacterium]|nr:MAG: hypothetical protein D4S01_02960 [Dehalococcoidia bacterium]